MTLRQLLLQQLQVVCVCVGVCVCVDTLDEERLMEKEKETETDNSLSLTPDWTAAQKCSVGREIILLQPTDADSKTNVTSRTARTS